MADEQATTYTELAVALGRVEEGIKGMKESLDRMEKRSEDHATVIARHESENMGVPFVRGCTDGRKV